MSGEVGIHITGHPHRIECEALVNDRAQRRVRANFCLIKTQSIQRVRNRIKRRVLHLMRIAIRCQKRIAVRAERVVRNDPARAGSDGRKIKEVRIGRNERGSACVEPGNDQPMRRTVIGDAIAPAYRRAFRAGGLPTGDVSGIRLSYCIW